MARIFFQISCLALSVGYLSISDFASASVWGAAAVIIGLLPREAA